MKVDIFVNIYINDWLGDTMALRDKGQGIYFLLILHYWKNGGPIEKDFDELMAIARTDDEKLLRKILDKYFIENENTYSHKRSDKEISIAQSRRESARENGKKGGRPTKGKNPEKTYGFNEGIPTNNPDCNPRYKLSETHEKPLSPSTFQHSSFSNQNSSDSNKDNIPYSEIVDYLNMKCSTNYKSTGQKTKDLIRARVNDGFTLDDFKKVIDNKSSEWLKTEWEKFLRPETLFSNKFESYLNQRVNNQSKPDQYNMDVEVGFGTTEEIYNG